MTTTTIAPTTTVSPAEPAPNADRHEGVVPAPGPASAVPLGHPDEGIALVMTHESGPGPHSGFWTTEAMFPLGGDGLPRPHFAVMEVAKFFGKGPDWLRWRYHPDKSKPPKFPNGYFVLDGKVLVPKKTSSGARFYTLADIERMAHALAQTGAIDSTALAQVVLLVRVLLLISGIGGDAEWQDVRPRGLVPARQRSWTYV